MYVKENWKVAFFMLGGYINGFRIHNNIDLSIKKLIRLILEPHDQGKESFGWIQGYIMLILRNYNHNLKDLNNMIPLVLILIFIIYTYNLCL